jgi:hypothetical protein
MSMIYHAHLVSKGIMNSYLCSVRKQIDYLKGHVDNLYFL